MKTIKNTVIGLLALSMMYTAPASAQAEVEPGQYYAGGVVGTLVGLGIGHAVQGRYGQMGWVFTVGELASAAMIVGGGVWGLTDAGNALSQGTIPVPVGATLLVTAGWVGSVGFRIWEIVDVWAGAKPVNNPAPMSLRPAMSMQKIASVGGGSEYMPSYGFALNF